MIWTLLIPGWMPTPLNQLLGKHWSKAGKAKKNDAEMIAAAVQVYGVTKCYMENIHRRRVEIVVELPPGKRAPDPDSLLKSTLDGLVKAGALFNDSQQWVDWPRPRFVRGDRLQTMITIQDV